MSGSWDWPVPTVHLIAFVVTAFVIIVIPGPSVMFVVGRALALDRRAALLSVLGNTMSEYLQVILVAFGAGLLLERSVVAFEVVKFGERATSCGWVFPPGGSALSSVGRL